MLASLADYAGVIQETTLQIIILAALFVSGFTEHNRISQLQQDAQRIREDLYRDLVEAGLKYHMDRHRTARLNRERRNR